jgi:hypothetical protein
MSRKKTQAEIPLDLFSSDVPPLQIDRRTNLLTNSQYSGVIGGHFATAFS